MLFNQIANDATNATALLAGEYAVKYTYEFAHVDTGSAPVGPPLNVLKYPLAHSTLWIALTPRLIAILLPVQRL